MGINSWFKLEGAKSGQVFIAGGYIPAEVPKKDNDKVTTVDLDSDLASALTRQQQMIDEEGTADRSQYVPKMSVQTVKIDDDLQSALKKQQKKIDVAQEKAELDVRPEEMKDESSVTETKDNKTQEKKSEEGRITTGMKSGIIPTEEEGFAKLGIREVVVEVIAGRNLEKSGMFGKADPYVTMTYGKEKHISNVINNNLNPEWNFKESLMTDANSSERVVIEVYDMDTVTRDDPMGSVELEIEDLEKLRDGQWIPLQGCKSGEIFIAATLPSSEFESTKEADPSSKETFTSDSATSQRDPKKDDKQGGGVRGVKAILTEEKQPDEDFEEAMLRRQQKLQEKETGADLSLEGKSVETTVEYDEDLEVAMERQQQKIESMTEKDFSAIKSAASPTGVQLDTDLEAAMKKRQMKIDQMKEGEFKDVTASSSVTTVKHDNDFEAAMNNRKAKIGEKVDDDQSSTSEVSEASTVKAVTVHEFKSEEEHIQMDEERMTKISLIQSQSEFYSDSEIERTVSSVLDNSAQAVVIEIPQKNLDGRFQTEDPSKSEDESTNNEIGEINVSPDVMIVDRNPQGDEQTIKLRVVGARKLKKSGMFGKADPYVTISYGELKFKSNVVKNNLNPEWKFDNIFTISDNISNEILLEVYDKDTVSKDDFMGKISVSTTDITKLKQGQWIPLQGTKSGEIFIACDVITDANVSAIVDDKEANNFARQPAGISELPKGSETAGSVIHKSQTPEEESQSKKLEGMKTTDNIDPSMRKTQDASAADIQTRTAYGAEYKTSIPEDISQHSELKGKDSLPKERTLKLTVISARKLKKSGLFGKADPYVALTYGSHKAKSSVVKNNLNPEWNFDNLLTINEKVSDEVLLEVYDKDTGSKDDFMGRGSLPISELTTLKQGQWIPLQKTKSGEICLSCVFVSDLESSGASGDRDAFERVESVEELETATLTDVETKKVGNQAGGIRAVKELLSAEKKPKDEFEHAKSSPGEADTQQRVASEAQFRAEDVKDELHLTVESA